MTQSSSDKSAVSSTRTTYHHGHLREALIEAAVQLIDEQGVEKLSVRETAKRAGVSPGAPFRHFATRTALLTAVAEQATERLELEVQQMMHAVEEQPPLVRFATIGRGYLKWAATYPVHFRIISDRSLIDYESSDKLISSNTNIRHLMQQLLRDAFGEQMDEHNQALAIITARALVYGLARMMVDGHFPEWGIAQQTTEQTVEEILDFFVKHLSKM